MAQAALAKIKQAEADAQQRIDEATQQAAQIVQQAHDDAKTAFAQCKQSCKQQAAQHKQQTQEDIQKKSAEHSDETALLCTQLKQQLLARKSQAVDAVIEIIGGS